MADDRAALTAKSSREKRVQTSDSIPHLGASPLHLHAGLPWLLCESTIYRATIYIHPFTSIHAQEHTADSIRNSTLVKECERASD